MLTRLILGLLLVYGPAANATEVCTFMANTFNLGCRSAIMTLEKDKVINSEITKNYLKLCNEASKNVYTQCEKDVAKYGKE